MSDTLGDYVRGLTLRRTRLAGNAARWRDQAATTRDPLLASEATLHLCRVEADLHVVDAMLADVTATTLAPSGVHP